MRSKDSAFLALLQGDQLDLVVFVEIDTADGPLRYVLDTEPRTWDGVSWTPTAGTFEEIQESAQRESPALQMVLQNADGVLGPLVHPASGGEDLRGRRVTIRQGDRTMLSHSTPDSVVIEWALFVNAYAWIGRAAISFELGVFPAEEVQVPERTCQGLRCRWAYRGTHCGYSGDLETCDRTREDCRRHFAGEALRFGGFPTASEARALRLT